MDLSNIRTCESNNNSECIVVRHELLTREAQVICYIQSHFMLPFCITKTLKNLTEDPHWQPRLRRAGPTPTNAHDSAYKKKGHMKDKYR